VTDHDPLNTHPSYGSGTAFYRMEVAVENMGTRFRKRGTVSYLQTQGHDDPGVFTVYSDEPAPLGGEGTAPLPLEYLLLGVGF
jgi:hypothetical protein